MRPSRCEAKCGTCTQGRIKNRVLYASSRTLRSRALGSQPMNRSRLPRCRGAEHHATQASGRPPA